MFVDCEVRDLVFDLWQVEKNGVFISGKVLLLCGYS